MKFTDHGLVLREVKTGESDRILSLLTRDHGILSVMAKGSMKPKSKLFSASGLFCFSEWTLRDGKNMYWADEASPVELFFGLRNSIEAIALATYLAEILQILSPTGPEAASLLRLGLNSFHVLASGARPPAFVKAVFEMRSLSEAGFQPDLSGCAACGDAPCWLDVAGGELLCGACAPHPEQLIRIEPPVLGALRHITTAPQDKVFSFRLPQGQLGALAYAAERFLLFHMDYPPKSLAFYHSLDTNEPT